MRGRAGARSVAAAIALVAAIGLLEARAHAASPPIAQVTAGTPLSGGEGWLVWSAPVPGGYALMGYHGGAAVRLPVTIAKQPFDAGVGTEANGAPVVTFSRCAITPSMAALGDSGPGGELLEPQTGSHCRVHELGLEGGSERALPIPVAPRDSDTTPSMWHGTVTFARHAPAHADVWQILSWSPRAPRRLVTLPHGRVPMGCPGGGRSCGRPQATVVALDSDGAIVTFLWWVTGAGIAPHVAEEVRVDRAGGRGAALAEGVLNGDVCMGAPMSRTPESIHPEAPLAAGPRALFANLYAYDCLHEFTSFLASHTAAAGYASRGRLRAVTLALAEDEGHLYGLVPQALETPGLLDAPPCTAARPCTIEPLATPALLRDARLPASPF